MKKITFTIDGPLMGYRQTTKKSIFHPKERARSQAYGAWKEKVRLLAYAAGLPDLGMALREKPPRLSTHVFWKKGVLRDWKNVHGAVEDSLWYLPQGDKYVKPGKYSDVTWDSGVEKAIVTVEL
jgi:hypothetical protein